MTFEQWEAGISEALKIDRIWRMRAYRLAFYAADVGWTDVNALAADPLTREVGAQLVRALGSVRANLAVAQRTGTQYSVRSQ